MIFEVMYELLPNEMIVSQIWMPEGEKKVATSEDAPASSMNFVFLSENQAWDGLSRKFPAK